MRVECLGVLVFLFWKYSRPAPQHSPTILAYPSCAKNDTLYVCVYESMYSGPAPQHSPTILAYSFYARNQNSISSAFGSLMGVSSRS